MDKIKILRKIRDITNLSLIDCNKLLIKYNYNLSLVIKNSSNIKKNKFNKKKDNILNNGKIISGLLDNNKYGFLLKIKCETEFVSKNNEFINFCNKINNYIILNKIKKINLINNFFYNYKLNLISKFNENIKISDLLILEGELIYNYLYRNKIGILIKTSKNSNLDILKGISMHIIFHKSKYISFKKYYNNIKKIKNNNYKKINNTINNDNIFEKSFMYQKYLLDNSIYIKDLINKNNINLYYFKTMNL